MGREAAPDMPDARQIEVWISSVRNDLEEIENEIQPLMERRSELRKQLELLRKLRSSLHQPTDGSEADSEARPSPEAWSYNSVGDRVRAQVRQILEEAGRPLHINKIHAEFQKRGFEIPGAGKPNNITVHISRRDSDSDIATPKRGLYALPEHVDN